jgi:hypothetical protein
MQEGSMSDDGLIIDIITEDGDVGGPTAVPIPIGLRQTVSSAAYLVGASTYAAMPISTQFRVPTNTQLFLDIGISASNPSASINWNYKITATNLILSSPNGMPSGTPITVTTPPNTGTICSLAVTYTPSNSNTIYMGNMYFTT